MCQTVEKKLAKEDAWIKDLDLDAFGAEMKALGKKLQREQGPEDGEHLKKMVNWSRIATVIGLLTLWMYPNPVTVFCLSLGTFMRWTMIGHHTCHGGYENVDTTCVGGPTTYKRFRFAWGSLYRRVIDWMDWMLPEAWDMEHNRTHHYKLGEIEDPDLVENNLVDLRASDAPLFAKYMTVAFFMMTWKWFYYAPNTYKCLKYAELRRDRLLTKSMIAKKEESVTVKALIAGTAEGLSLTEFITRIIGPVFIYNFVILPLPVWLLFGETSYYYAMINLLLAEIVTNIHSFIAIVTNHAGDDLYRFDTPCRAHTPTFYLRAIISSANFSSGTDVVDVAHGFLNYQIEHHSWPFLSMRSYQKAQPQVEAICKKYGVPYVKHNVFWRLKKTVDIMVGTAKMRTWPEGVVDETRFR